MATVTTTEKRIRCPVCDTLVNEMDLARGNLTREELIILKRHKNEETLGKLIQLVDITMNKISPEKILQESEMKRIMTVLQRTIEEVDHRLSGTAIGKIGEMITVKELKTAFPQDKFSDEKAPRGETDVIATVIENNLEQGKIAISSKYDTHWRTDFLDQLNRNMAEERTAFGILVTKSFPSEALNDRVHYIELKTGEEIMLVKPEYLSVAYGGYRKSVLAWVHAKKTIQSIEEQQKNQRQILKIVSKWMNSRSNPVLKKIDELKKLSTETDEITNRFVKYVKTFSNNIHSCEEEKREQLDLVQDALEDLEKQLTPKNNTEEQSD